MGNERIKPSVAEQEAVARELAALCRVNGLTVPLLELDGNVRSPQAGHAEGAVRIPPRFAVGWFGAAGTRSAVLAWALADLHQGPRPWWRRVLHAVRGPSAIAAGGLTVMAVLPRLYGQDGALPLFPAMVSWAAVLGVAGVHHVYESQRVDAVDTRRQGLLHTAAGTSDEAGGEQ